jgi:hypothetical protein
MAKNITKYSIFLGSPSDLEEERIAIEEIIKELNITFGPTNNLVLELLKWETHSAPGITSSNTQDLINDDLGYEYDIFLGIIWKKFGTPTEKANSGTEEEFINAVKRFKSDNSSVQVLFYFKNEISSLKDINVRELLKIEEFKESIKEDNILYWDFDSCENLKNFLRLHIPKRINTLIDNSKKASTELVPQKNTPIGLVDEMSDYGVFDYNEIFVNLLNDSTNSLTKIAEDTTWIGEEFTLKNIEITTLTELPNPSKTGISSILKRIAKLLNDYAKRIEFETPIFYFSFEEGIKAGINMLNIVDDFNSQETILNLEENKDSIMELRMAVPEAINGMKTLYESLKSLPRIQKDVNVAKKNLLIKVEDLINKLENTLELSIEYSNELSNKIDKLKVSLDK